MTLKSTYFIRLLLEWELIDEEKERGRPYTKEKRRQRIEELFYERTN